jgi:hypothetical protein
MIIRPNDSLPARAVRFLKWCYRFVHEDWQHANRDASLPDQGFEREFRRRCTVDFGRFDWIVSQAREMQLTGSLGTASGVLHEIDLVAQCSDVVAVAELKNRLGYPPEKNDVIVFFAKLLDYLALNPRLLHREVVPMFLSTAPLEETGLAACLGLGIHPVAPSLRPLPILMDSGRLMNVELNRGLVVSTQVRERFDDFAAHINRLSLALEAMGLSSRCGYGSENTIVLKAIDGMEAATLANDLRLLNVECSRLLQEFRAAKMSVA